MVKNSKLYANNNKNQTLNKIFLNMKSIIILNQYDTLLLALTKHRKKLLFKKPG